MFRILVFTISTLLTVIHALPAGDLASGSNLRITLSRRSDESDIVDLGRMRNALHEEQA
jgi:hypothetical protein